jgi:hypothetical protein
MTTSNKPGVIYWIIAIIALIWNIMGVMAYLTQAFMSDEAKALLPEADQAMYSEIPAWATAAFALAVFGGFLGSLALLLRKKWATFVFIISLLGILAQQTYYFFVSNIMEEAGVADMAMPLMIVVVGIFLVYYSKGAAKTGLLK